MYKIALVLLVSLLLCSCVQEDFSVDSSSLYRNIELEIDNGGKVLDYKEYATLSAVFSDDELLYTFQIKSHDGDLVWEGEFSSAGSAELGLTEGASFQAGIYQMIVYADNGTDINLELNLSDVDNQFPYISSDGSLVADSPVTIIEYDENQTEIKRGESISEYKVDNNSRSVVISYVDRYLNRVTIHEDLL